MINHPDYINYLHDWMKWRYSYKGGRDFINRYLQKFSARENQSDFELRKTITYCPRFAGAAIDDVKNAIYQRLIDISRVGGSPTYQTAQRGEEFGVDLRGNSMTSFMGTDVLPELLVMGRVGIYVDMPPVKGPTLKDNQGLRPYMYTYPVERIINWTESQEPGFFDRVVLEDEHLEYDTKRLPIGRVKTLREIWREDGRVYVEFTYADGKKSNPIPLDLQRIPFVGVEITNSLMVDLADYQITLLNMASSDVGYVLRSNFPFFVEQVNMQTLIENQFGAAEVDADKKREVTAGTTHGRQYPIGADAPSFIHPSSEPIKASMAKQEQMKEEMRLLLNLSISNLRPAKVSAESKSKDSEGLNSGLSYIGLTLERAERQIAQIWSNYEGVEDIATVTYPQNYELRTSEDRINEAQNILKMINFVPSLTFKRECFSLAAKTIVGNVTQSDTIEKIITEIQTCDHLSSDPKEIRSDVEAGILDHELASKIRGYPEGTADKAAEEHMERLTRIKIAQTDPTNMPGTDGSQAATSDEQVDPVVKNVDTTESDSSSTPMRGEGK